MKKSVKMLKPFAFAMFLLVSFVFWHVSIITLMPGMKVRDVLKEFILLSNLYLAVSLAIAGLLFVLYTFIKKKLLSRIVYWKILLVTLFLLLIRIVDWGTIYFSGKHVDSLFWYHAFYVDGTSFFFTKMSAIVFVFSILWMILFSKLTDLFIKNIASVKNDMRTHSKINGLALVCVLVLLNMPLLFASSKDTDADVRQYVEIPEIKVIGSFIDYALKPAPAESYKLESHIVTKLKAAGVSVNPDAEYPLMKDSIYLDPQSRDSEKPRIPVGTNIIIIFLESFNGVFLRDDLHGYHGLTDNLHEVREQSMSFERMYSAAYPTERGMIAILGSSLYSLSRITGKFDKMKPPIPCRFLLLSDVLKQYGYTNWHVKGGSGFFGGMKSSFENKQNYDKFIAWESVELQMYVTGTRKKGWGIRDDDIFDFAANLLRDDKIKQPFMLTMNSLDMHPPYDPTHTHPNAKGSTLMNTIYSTDRGFGVFWEYFKNSPYRDNTVLIVTTDHPMGVGTGLKQFFQEFDYPATTHCDIVPFLVLLPGDHEWNGRRVDTLCSNIDFAPTLMDMMDIDAKNPFLGLSVFSERKNNPLPMTSYFTPTYPAVMNHLNAEEKRAVFSLNWKTEDQKNLGRYLQQLIVQRKIYPEKKDEERVLR